MRFWKGLGLAEDAGGSALGALGFLRNVPSGTNCCFFLLPVDLLVTVRIFISLPLNTVNLATSRIMAIMMFTAALIC